MTADNASDPPRPSETPTFGWGPFGTFQAYWLDACQRAILTLDVLRQRGNTYRERSGSEIAHVLSFDANLVRDGRTLPRPVNYLLVRIPSPEGVSVDPRRRPFIVVDPRAGHGPGIGGMKQDSEIGVAMAAGHPCYFIGFLPEPVPGQTIEDVCRAEAAFIAEVAALHPQAEGKPAIIANCQAGWQTMIMAALNPHLAGPLLLAGAPLSYWAGVHGKNPMRYSGGMLGGTWLTHMAGDLGHGVFDGANLVANFESLNPANTYWDKPYNVYSKIDTEAERFLDFETWWGNPVLLNAEEMQWIADNLFVGNKLTSGSLRTTDGFPIDLRNIRSPIIVFCSWGDDITPPQQALGWITDLYADDRQLVENGQAIVYCLHQTIGHLGIFVSGKVATKEHSEFADAMTMVDLAPPGLYEAVITEVDAETANPELIDGRYLFRLERRSLDDIRALGGNDAEDERRFETVARVSEINQALYRTVAAPAVQAMATPAAAELTRQMHPHRLRYALFSDVNPLMAPVEGLAKAVREARAPVAPDNPFAAAEAAMSAWTSACLEAYGVARDTATEALFLATYGSPVLQAMVGVDAEAPPSRSERDPLRDAEVSRRRAELETRFENGDPVDATLRSLLYIQAPQGAADERAFSVLESFHEAQPPEARRTLEELKAELREQSFLLRMDEERAIRAIPRLLPKDPDQRRASLTALHHVVESRGALPEEVQRRLDRVDALFDVKLDPPLSLETLHA